MTSFSFLCQHFESLDTSIDEMTATTQLASVLVARFLRSNNYTETLNVFIREAGLAADAGQPDGKTDKSQWTIEGVLEEKKVFDESVKFERYGKSEEKDVWTVPGQLTIVPSLTCNVMLRRYLYLLTRPSTLNTKCHPDTNVCQSPSMFGRALAES